MQRNTNGWKLWMLGVAGVIIICLGTVLFDVIADLYKDAKADHRAIIERLEHLERQDMRGC